MMDGEFNYDNTFVLRNRKMVNIKTLSHLIKYEIEPAQHFRGRDDTNYGYYDHDDPKRTIHWPGMPNNMPFDLNSNRHYREAFHEFPILNELE